MMELPEGQKRFKIAFITSVTTSTCERAEQSGNIADRAENRVSGAVSGHSRKCL